MKKTKRFRYAKYLAYPGSSLHVADAEYMDHRANAGHDQQHYRRQLIDLQRQIDLELSNRHPRPVREHERRAVRVACECRNDSQRHDERR